MQFFSNLYSIKLGTKHFAFFSTSSVLPCVDLKIPRAWRRCLASAILDWNHPRRGAWPRNRKNSCWETATYCHDLSYCSGYTPARRSDGARPKVGGWRCSWWCCESTSSWALGVPFALTSFAGRQEDLGVSCHAGKARASCHVEKKWSIVNFAIPCAEERVGGARSDPWSCLNCLFTMKVET